MEICDYLKASPCVCVCVCVCVCERFVLCRVFISRPSKKALCQCSSRHLNRHETHFQWDTDHLSLSQQRAVLQCQPSAISTGISFLAEHWQAFRVSWGHSRPREAQRASNKWSSGQHTVRVSDNWTPRKCVTGAEDQLQTVSKAASVLS